jgi:hypothetical protein
MGIAGSLKTRKTKPKQKCYCRCLLFDNDHMAHGKNMQVPNKKTEKHKKILFSSRCLVIRKHGIVRIKRSR